MNSVVLMVITLLDAVLYFAAAFFISASKTKKLSNIFYAAATGINLFLVIRNAVLNGYVPFVSMYHVLTFLGVTMTISAFYMCFIKKQMVLLKFFPFISGVILIGVGFMSNNGAWHFPPALDSPFFVPHVLMYMLSYTLCAASFAACLFGLIKKEQKEQYDGACVLLVRTAVPFMFTGMLLGAVWANEVWGAFWSWDIKESFSLVTLLLYSGYLHTVKVKKFGLISKILLILGLTALAFTLLFVNMIPSESLHVYSQ